MTSRSLGLFVKKLQPKVGLGRYDILFAYFVVEAKSKNQSGEEDDIEETINLAVDEPGHGNLEESVLVSLQGEVSEPVLESLNIPNDFEEQGDLAIQEP